MRLFNIFKPKATTLKDPEFLTEFGPIPTGAGAPVTPDTALRISAVYGCVRILAETVSSLPLRVYQRTGETRQAVDHPLNDLLGVSSNGEQTAMEMREFQMSSLGLRGNAFGVKSLTRGGAVGEISPLKPGFMHIDRDAAGRLVFDYHEPGNGGVYSADQIWRVAGLSSDGITGMSPVTLARENFGIALASEQSAARVFSNGAQTATTLEFPNKLSTEQIDNLRAQWADNYSGYKNHHKPMILESGMKANNIGMSLADAQFIEGRKFQIAEIARWYRVPLHMLNELDKATFSNIEHQSIEFVVHTIRPWLVRIEQTASRDLLTPAERRRGLYVSHTVEGLLRGDTKNRYEAYGKGITDGWLSRNEVRRLENLNPVDGLDDYLIPLNMASGNDAAETNIAEAENRVLAKEAGARDIESFVAWLPGFYARQTRRIYEEFGVDASEYAAVRIGRMADYTNPIEAAAHAEKFTKTDIGALLHE